MFGSTFSIRTWIFLVHSQQKILDKINHESNKHLQSFKRRCHFATLPNLPPKVLLSVILVREISEWIPQRLHVPICVGVQSLIGSHYSRAFIYTHDCLWKVGMTIPQYKYFTPWHFCEAFSRSVCGTTSVARASTSLAVAMCCAWKWGATSWSLSIQKCFEVKNWGFRMVF